MSGDDGRDGHEHDLVMPGFRFHPTEEELIEFYLRRKVEGKRFNVELINFLDLYRYDPWELPALAAIGEKEWFFYVPRDRKYRSGDRPNRVTTSGYWKATGADRTIRTENSRSIGLKKTLVFYSGKAPKGIRTSWIMNEYRLPQSETDRLQKAEISLCRVYKRSGVDDHRQLPDMPSSNPSSSKGPGSDRKRNTDPQQSSSFRKLGEKMERLPKIVGSNYTGGTAFPLSNGQAIYSSTASVAPSSSATSTEDDCTPKHHLASSILTPMATSSMATATIDELSRLVGYNPIYKHQPNQLHPLPPQPQLLLNAVSVSLPSVSDKLWEWNPLQEAWRDYTSFK